MYTYGQIFIPIEIFTKLYNSNPILYNPNPMLYSLNFRPNMLLKFRFNVGMFSFDYTNH